MKRRQENAWGPPEWGSEAVSKRRAAPSAGGAGPGGQRVCLKLLFPEEEARVIQGEDGATAKSLENLTGAQVQLSAQDEHYPGTQLRELTVRGGSLEAVLNAVLLALSQVSDMNGSVSGGEANVEPDGARLKVVVPHEVASSLDGPRLEQLKLPLSVTASIVPIVIPPGAVTELSEQVICLSGGHAGVQGALQSIAKLVVAAAGKSWFPRWAGHSHCGLQMPGLSLLQAPGGGSYHRSRWDEGAGDCGFTTGPGGCFGTPPGGCDGLHDGGGWGDGGGYADAGGPMALKLLLSTEEGQVLRCRMDEVRQATGAELGLSQEGEAYPGTALEELTILGSSPAATAAAGTEALGRVVEALGSLGGGAPSPEPGAAHIKVVIPSKATSAVIGPGGQIVARIRAQTQMHVHVEMTTVPLGGYSDISEQVVSFDGPLSGVQLALEMMTDILSQFVVEPWFGIWAANSNSGHVIPGLILFQDIKGKGKGKGKIKGKDGFMWYGGGGGLAMKLLLPPNEASCVLGKGGATVREIGHTTGTKMSLSNRDQFYPGTQLQEFVVKGSTQESVLSAIRQALERIADVSGAICGGESNVEPGGCRLKVVVPSQSASAIIGPGGSFVKSMREKSRMHIHIEETTIPPGPPNELTDQVVCLSGPLHGTGIALSMLAEAVGHFTNEVWFEAWSSNSHCGLVVPGLVLFVDGKGKGKGKFKGKGMKWDEEDFHSMAPGLPGYGADFQQKPLGKMSPMMGKNGGGFVADVAASAQPGAMTLKVLVSSEEVSVLSADSSTMSQIQQATGTTGMLSEKFYPGTALQELTIQGPSPDAVFNAILLILTKVAEVVGAVRSGEQSVPPGDARVKIVVPKRAAAAIIGPGGQNVKQLKVQAGIHVHVDANSIPCGYAVSEQGVCLAGPVASMQMAISQVVAEVANCCCEPWYEVWAAHSNAGHVIPGLTLFEGKGKGGKGGGYAGYGGPFI